jgi:anti-anti-sigma regulatory factor
MRSEELEIQIEDWKENIVLRLKGRFHNEQIPNMREKIDGLISSDNRSFILDFSDVQELDHDVSSFLLEMLNTIRGKGGDLRIVYGPHDVFLKLEKYRNIFRLYPDMKSLISGGFLKRLQARGIVLSRKTGVRLSRSIAIILLVALSGWFISMLFILVLQHSQIAKQKAELILLKESKTKTTIRMKNLEERLKPFKDLGIVSDSGRAY